MQTFHLFQVLVLLRSCTGAAAEAYAYTDPALFDAQLSMEQFTEEQRSASSCSCSESRHGDFWHQILAELKSGLAKDMGFRGDWVHSLCSRVYPIIFRTVSIDPIDGTFTMHTDCPVAVLGMVVVCSQSAALQYASAATTDEKSSEEVQAPGEWRRTPRVVADEGAAVADFFVAMPLEECIDQCHRNPACRSLAHGPHGCHLKARCVSEDDPLVPQGSQGADYQTHYVVGGPCSAGGKAGQDIAEEVASMMSLVIRVLEFAFLCLESSEWPFSSGEVFENYARFVENPSDFLWQRAVSFRLLPESFAANMSSSQDWRQTAYLTRLRIRWSRGLESEASFWRKKLSMSDEINDSLGRLKGWLANGSVVWTLPGDDMCEFLQDRLERVGAGRDGLQVAPPPRVLNAGSGPFAPRPLDCRIQKGGAAPAASVVPVVATDGLARYYQQVYDEHGFQPLYWPLQCPVEELDTCFPASHFDVVHIRNALDHSFDPALGIAKMLHVVRPGGWVLLRHARNEGVPGQFRNGLHQWSFDVYERQNGETGFLIWNPGLRSNVTDYLLETGLAAEVRCELRDHPSDDAPEDERFVWVEIRKPTRDELASGLESRTNSG